MNPRTVLFVGAILGGLGVACGAFGAHGLEGEFSRRGLSPQDLQKKLDVWDVAVRYQMYHALALVMIGVLGMVTAPSLSLRVATWSFLVGILVFSGLLYALVLTGVKILGAIVPIGGVALIVGWIALAVSAWGRMRE